MQPKEAWIDLNKELLPGQEVSIIDCELQEEYDPLDLLVLAAYHEAGHAVVAALQRYPYGVNFRQYMPFRYVTIRPRKDRSQSGKLVGAVRFRPLKYWSDVCIIVALAGSCAEANLDPVAYDRDAQADDFSKAGKIMEYLDLEVSIQNIKPYWDQSKCVESCKFFAALR